ncbi:hypothetical protein HHI36_009295 [Cryptolaemus montrouzieri]|uniref:Uncharacterized protein n=1 Tax=Cryptolaemus montrouzieri TaxID=559131 RepID=A0ABD2MV20_9CUCU
MRSHPGKTMTIYDIPGILTTGIVSFNRNLFTELHFAPAFVTDRPNPIGAGDGLIPNTSIPGDKTPPPSSSILTLESPEELEEPTNAASFVQQPMENMPQYSQALGEEQVNVITNPALLITLLLSSISNVRLSPTPSTSFQSIPVLTNQTQNVTTSTTPPLFSPEAIRPLPTAPLRKLTNRGRKTRKSAIYTDTPEKEEIRRVGFYTLNLKILCCHIPPFYSFYFRVFLVIQNDKFKTKYNK